MRPNLITRLKEEWNNLDPVDPLRGLIADAIDALAEHSTNRPTSRLDAYPKEQVAAAKEDVLSAVERHGLAEQTAQQQEPVAVYVGETWCGSVVRLYDDLPLETPLYTSPPASKPWVGLTEYDIDHIPYSCSHADSRLIAYAIEAKLREKNT